jgi:hypothetical protein
MLERDELAAPIQLLPRERRNVAGTVGAGQRCGDADEKISMSR